MITSANFRDLLVELGLAQTYESGCAIRNILELNVVKPYQIGKANYTFEVLRFCNTPVAILQRLI